VRHVVDEICDVQHRYGMRSVAFFDDIFVTQHDWLTEFAEEYSRRVTLPFECNLRVEQVTAAGVAQLRRAGCTIIALGVEVADEEVRASILRRRYSNEQLIEAAARIREHGIQLKTYNILGLPPGDLRAEWNTLMFNRTLRADFPTASLFQPYPGTDLGEKTRASGYWLEDIDSINLGFYRRSPLALCDRRKIELLQKLFFLGVKVPVALPIVRWLVQCGENPLVYALVSASSAGLFRLALAIGRNIGIVEDAWRRLLFWSARRTHHESSRRSSAAQGSEWRTGT
jgi:hypothetical protein